VPFCSNFVNFVNLRTTVHALDFSSKQRNVTSCFRNFEHLVGWLLFKKVYNEITHGAV
jgi:hypothetical protein